MKKEIEGRKRDMKDKQDGQEASQLQMDRVEDRL